MTNEQLAQRLRDHDMRPTKQRLAIAAHLFDGTDKHVSAESVYTNLQQSGIHLSIGTVYNSLRHFADAGLLRAVPGLGDHLTYDTNIGAHHHLLDVDTGEIIDIPAISQPVTSADLPEGFELEAVEITYKVKRTS